MKLLTLFAILLAGALACGYESPEFKRKRLSLEAIQKLGPTDASYYAKRTTAECNNLRPGAAANSGDWNWRPIKIFFDMTRLNKQLTDAGLANRIPFYKRVFDVAKEWYNKTLMVRDKKFGADGTTPLMSTMINNFDILDPKDTIQMGGSDPNEFDLIVWVVYDQTTKQGEYTLAYAGPAYRHPCSRRPLLGGMGMTKYGDDTWAAVGETQMNDAVTVVIHEFAHIIAFIGWEKFQVPNIKAAGPTGWLWTGAKVAAKAQAHFGCKPQDYFQGVPLEISMIDGKSVLGAHFSEEHFGTEALTPVVGGDPDIISEFTLALFEDSTWYKSNYGMAEKWTFGKGTGCNWSSCALQTCKPGHQEFVSLDRTAIAACHKSDIGCGYEISKAGKKCTHPNGWTPSQGKFSEYGSSFGGQCAVAHGKFHSYYLAADKSGYWNDYSGFIPVESNCAEDKRSYTLTFKNAKFVGKTRGGDVTVTCAAKGTVRYNLQAEKSSSVDCEDPETFCHARFGEWEDCPHNCGYEGRCAHRSMDGVVNLAQENSVSKVSRMMLGGTRTIRFSQAFTPANSFINHSGKTEKNWKCWCYTTKNWSQQANGSCSPPTVSTAPAQTPALQKQRALNAAW